MKCARCGTDNLPSARHCHGCGALLAPAAGALSAGTVLQRRYRIERQLGQGGMGAVYLAEHLALGERVAVKEMREDLLDPGERPHAVAQFQAEARTLARLRHPNLPRVLDHFAENARWYLVLDYVEGQTLDRVQATAGGGPLPKAQVLDWAFQLCDVLAYLHGQNSPVIFRDLKPANIMVDDQGRIKLIDFGIARIFHPAKDTDTLKMGTAGYAPPEQYAGRGQTTPRSDLYALGATLHQLLTGSDPTIMPFSFTPPQDLSPGVSARLSQAVMKALSMDPADRFATAAEMKRALQAAPEGRSVVGDGWMRWQKVVAGSLAIGTVLALLGLGAIVVYRLVQTPPTANITPSMTITEVAVDTPSPGTTQGTATPLIEPPVPSETAEPQGPRQPTSTPIPTETNLIAWIPIVLGTRPTLPPIAGAPPAPALLRPEPGVSLSNKWRFEWQWGHRDLLQGQAFDLLIWSDQENRLDRSMWRGVITPWRQTFADVEVGEVATVKEHGEGTYYWTVIVVQKDPYRRIGQWGEIRSFTYRYPSTSAGRPSESPPTAAMPPTSLPLPPTKAPASTVTKEPLPRITATAGP